MPHWRIPCIPHFFRLLLALLHDGPAAKLEIEDYRNNNFTYTKPPWWQLVPAMSSLAASLLQLLLSCFVVGRKSEEDVSDADRESPEYSASFLAGIYYTWLDPLIWKVRGKSEIHAGDYARCCFWLFATIVLRMSLAAAERE